MLHLDYPPGEGDGSCWSSRAFVRVACHSGPQVQLESRPFCLVVRLCAWTCLDDMRAKNDDEGDQKNQDQSTIIKSDNYTDSKSICNI